MNETKKKERTERVLKMNAQLQKLYPSAQIELTYTTPFECLVAVVLSAQCTDKRVNEITPTLFKKYKTVSSYAHAKQSDVEALIFACGFYHSKAKYIIGAAKIVHHEFDDEVPKTLKELITLPGVARKTANVVLASVYGIVEGIAVDTHIRRFAIRFNLSDYTDPKRIEKDLMEIVPKELWWEFTHRLVHYGRHVCKAHKHDCSLHPLTAVYFEANTRWPKAR